MLAHLVEVLGINLSRTLPLLYDVSSSFAVVTFSAVEGSRIVPDLVLA